MPAPANPPRPKPPPEVFQLIVQCQDESQQRDLFQRLRREGLKVRVLVL